MSKKEIIDEQGWLLIKNVFTVEEINSFKEYVEKDKDHKGDLLSAEHLWKVITSDKTLDIFKECIGTDSLYYYGDSTFSINKSGNGFHKDSKDRHNKDSIEYKDKNYSLLRLGIYLQDHTQYSKGLCLRSHSHLSPSLNKGKIVNVKSEVGDVVIWKMTTTHSANADILSFLPNYALHPRISRRVPKALIKKAPNPRIALFMSFGKKDQYAEDYIEYLKTRKYAVDRWVHTHYDESKLSLMKEKNVEIYTDFDIDSIDMKSVNLEHKDLS